MYRPAVKATARTLIGVLLFNALSPLSVLANDKPAPNPVVQRQIQQLSALNQKIEQAKAEKARTPAERLTRDFHQAQDLVRILHADQRSRQSKAKAGEREPMEMRAIGPDMRIEVERSPLDRLSDERRAESESRLREHLRTLTKSRASARADFDVTRKELLAKKLPSEILDRHDQAVRDFEQRATQFERTAQLWTNGSNETKSVALAELDDFFKRNPASRTAAPLNPKKLPWRAPEPTSRQPADTQAAWTQNLYESPRAKAMQAAGGSVGPINFNVPPESGQAPVEADLAETPETQRSAAIAAKAAELGNNPLAIHNWVRNNLDWIPSWGAVQSAEDTLFKKRGNAHDIASLEIALLRAANIPARYQYGTIEVDAEKLQNWVGGTTKVEAAQQLLGQGGIANRGILVGGQIGKVRMEHVWVSAYVNWLPSRGAKQGAASQHVNPNGKLNAWVPLDPSYKQYSYTQGLDLKAAVPLDPQALNNAAQQGATVNAQEGWVQNLNQAAVQAQLNDYQARLKTYIDSQNANATVGDVIGKKIISQQLPSLLAGSLPYAVVQTGQRTSAVPANLQHQFRFELLLPDNVTGDGTSLLSFQQKTSQLAGKRITLSYLPATQADADVIASYLPKPHADGSPIQPSELPTSLPGYLIRLKPQVTLDGQIVATSSQALTMGTDLFSSAGFTRFSNSSEWDTTPAESHAVGQATAIGLSLQGVNSAQLSQLNSRLEVSKAQLQAKNFSGLTGEQISGDLLIATLWSWFAVAEAHGKLSQTQANITENPGLSYGLFHAVVQPIYSWGVIRQVKFPGVNIDVPHVRNLTASKSATTAEWIGFNRMRGQYMSGLEHAVPERFFNDADKCNLAEAPSPTPALPSCPQGISAVKVIGIAAQAGQRIYNITPGVFAANPNVVRNQLGAQSANTQARVQNYLEAGLEVSVHERPVTQGEWTGAAIVVTDMTTGAGGYLIEGGANGGWLEGFVVGATLGIILTAFSSVSLAGLFGLSLAAGIAAVAISAILVFVLVIPLIVLMAQLYLAGAGEWRPCFWGGFGVGLSFGTRGVSGMLGELAWLIGIAMGIGVPNNAGTQCF